MRPGDRGEPHLREIDLLATLALLTGEVKAFQAWCASYHFNLLRIAEALTLLTPDLQGLLLVNAELLTRQFAGEDSLTSSFGIYPLHLTMIDHCVEFSWQLQYDLKNAILLLLAADRKLAEKLRNLAIELRAFGASEEKRWLFKTPEDVLNVLREFYAEWCFAQGNDLPLSVLLWGLKRIAAIEPDSDVAAAYIDLNSILDLDFFEIFGYSVVVNLSSMELQLLEGGDAEVRIYYEAYAHLASNKPLKELQEENPFPIPSAT